MTTPERNIRPPQHHYEFVPLAGKVMSLAIQPDSGAPAVLTLKPYGNEANISLPSTDGTDTKHVKLPIFGIDHNGGVWSGPYAVDRYLLTPGMDQEGRPILTPAGRITAERFEAERIPRFLFSLDTDEEYPKLTVARSTEPGPAYAFIPSSGQPMPEEPASALRREKERQMLATLTSALSPFFSNSAQEAGTTITRVSPLEYSFPTSWNKIRKLLPFGGFSVQGPDVRFSFVQTNLERHRRENAGYLSIMSTDTHGQTDTVTAEVSGVAEGNKGRVMIRAGTRVMMERFAEALPKAIPLILPGGQSGNPAQGK